MVGRLSLKDSNWHLLNPRSLIRRHCIYDVRSLFTISIIKYRLLTSWRTARSKSAFMKNEAVAFSQRFDFGISRKSQLGVSFQCILLLGDYNLSSSLCVQACPEITSKSNWLSNRPPNRFNDPLQVYARFLKKFTILYNKCFSLRARPRVIKKRWMTAGPLKSIKKKDMYKQCLEDSNREREHLYKKYKNKLNHLLRISKN